MSITTPPTVDPLPSPVPTRDDSANFSTRADAFLAALPTWATQLASLASNVWANAVEAYNNAVAALASQTAAASSQAAAANSAVVAASAAGAPLWVSGTTYTVGYSVWSPITALTYRCISGTSGTTDPSADNTHWALAATGQPQLIPVSGTTVSAQFGGKYQLNNAAQTAIVLPTSMPAGPTPGAIYGAPNNGRGDNYFDPGSNPINGVVGRLYISDPNETAGLEWWGGATGWRLL